MSLSLDQSRIVGLTGNIATGKSAVRLQLESLGATAIDADAVAREVVAPGQPALAQIVREFGQAMLNANGTLNRQALGDLVFGDPAKLKVLESITHPAVRAAIRTRIQLLPAGAIVVLEMIKLFESGWSERCAEVWVTHCPEELQRERLMRGRGLTDAAARARIAAQPPQAEKLARADVAIDTSGTLEDTRRQVLAAWDKFLARLAR
jgi:dephospho-CoA kinase